MTLKNLALSAATAATLVVTGSANATIIGVPSEGLLVPFGTAGVNSVEGSDFFTQIQTFTGVLIETPALVGADTIINDYTAPNTTKGGYTPPENKGEWGGAMTVHYYMFDDKSQHVYDSTFVMSPDDVYFWVPPENTWPWVGYVVFADEAARRGGPATFVMTGQAGWVYSQSFAAAPSPLDDIADIPVVPLADGDDAAGIRIGNEITYSPQQLPRIQDVVPIVAGTRYYGAPGTTTTIVTGLVPITENYLGLGSIMHAMWFSENGMHADIDFCDDEELCVSCTDWTFNEANLLIQEGEVFLDGAQYFKVLLSCTSEEDCMTKFGALPYNDSCGVAGTDYSFADSPGIGMALYEFASKAGVAGVNFQLGVSHLTGDDWLTAPMLTNGQF